MRWILVSLGCLVLAGCCSGPQAPTRNPFGPQAAIAPPATGSDAPGYSQPLLAQGLAKPSSMTARGQGLGIVPPPSTASWGRNYTELAEVQPSTKLAQRSIYETIQPRSLRLRAKGAETPSADGQGSQVRLASCEEPADGGVGWASRTGSVQKNSLQEDSAPPTSKLYSHAEDYSWLRGELQYSQIDRRWKLRYMRCDEGSCDKFGGSVIISDKAAISGLERGEIVEVRGEIGEIDPNIGGFAPLYHVSQIRKSS